MDLEDQERIARRLEKQREPPMASSLRMLVLKAAQEQAALMEIARSGRLCLCHPGTWLEIHEEAHLFDYGYHVAQARQTAAVDLPHQLRRAGAPENAVARIHLGGLDERPSLFAAKVWLGIEPERLGVQGKHAALQVRVQQGRERRPFLGLFGVTDRGKTLAAVYALMARMRRYAWNSGSTGDRQSRPFYFVRFTEFAAVLAWDSATREWVEGLKRARCLVLDDMGKEFLSPVAQGMLFELLDVRYGQGLDTIITSQATVGEFQARYDGPPVPGGKPGAIFRRLKERGVILRDGGDEKGALLMVGDTELKKWAGKKDAP